MQTRYRFIKGEEQDLHLDSLAKINASEYPYRSQIVLWPGAILAALTIGGGKAKITHRIRVADISASEWGVQAVMFELVTGKIFRLGNVPARLFDTDIAMKVPAVTQIERTVKTFILPNGESKFTYNVNVGAVVMNKAARNEQKSQLVHWTHLVPDYFKTYQERDFSVEEYMTNRYQLVDGEK